MRTKIAGSARKHKVGNARILAIMATAHTIETDPKGKDPKITWIGTDERGFEIEVTAVVLPELLLVIHAMPLYRKDRS